jgi:tagatose 1,6-diphosphate aldolase
VKPEVVARNMSEFSRPEYRVDVLKVGVPVSMAFVEDSPAAASEILYSREEAIDYYRRAAEEARVPFIYLSQGVSSVPVRAGTGRGG